MRRIFWLSLLPERWLRHKHRTASPVLVDPDDGWTRYTEAAYWKWCRRDKIKELFR